MSYFTAEKIGFALAKARVSSGLSQREVARQLNRGERTIQSWEKGLSSPDADEIMDWCSACGVSPFSVFQEMMHPELYHHPDADKDDKQISRELTKYVQALPPITKRLLLFILKGRHGSYPPAVISEVAANLHCPMISRVVVCGCITTQYEYSRIHKLDPCPYDIQPPIEDLKKAYWAGRDASERGAQGYIGSRKE